MVEVESTFKYIATDKNGTAWCYECEPERAETCFTVVSGMAVRATSFGIPKELWPEPGVLSELTIVSRVGVKPRLKMDDTVWVSHNKVESASSTWVRGHFAGWEWGGSRMLCWDRGRTSHTGDNKTAWERWRTTDPEGDNNE